LLDRSDRRAKLTTELSYSLVLSGGSQVMSRKAAIYYGVSLAAVAVAVFLRWLLDPWLGDYLPLATLYGAVAFSVYAGGFRPALLITVLGYLASNWLFVEPRQQFSLRCSENCSSADSFAVCFTEWEFRFRLSHYVMDVDRLPVQD